MVYNTNFKSNDTSNEHGLNSIKTLLLNDHGDKIVQQKK